MMIKAGGNREYIVVKGSETMDVPDDKLDFD
jgi:hypothetical protein